MTMQISVPGTPLIPENAPFSIEQRAWLNGFFAGVFSIDTAPRLASSTDLVLAGAQLPAAEDDGAPWHDPAMEMAERMTLADGKPLNRRMMAAMAQQDCGQCGYTCETYANAINDKSEGRLTLCAPGGKETARMLKALYEEIGGVAPRAQESVSEPKTGELGRCREAPVTATFVSRERLNSEGSEKVTNHIEIDLAAAGVDYIAGDSLGVFVKNDPTLVNAIIEAIGAPANAIIGAKTLRDVLIEERALSPAPDALFELIACLVGGERRQKAKALAKGEDPDGDAAALDVLAALEKFSNVRPNPEAFLEALDPLQPRLYSISSSPKANPGRVTLTVDTVRYDISGRTRQGVASTYLGERIAPNEPLSIYVQKAHGFALPGNPETPIIMVGPGTGVAPFRAFLQERHATGAPGPCWLFYGHQREASDFFYRSEFESLQAKGTLTHLSTAWSRDGAAKVYVQDRMIEAGADIAEWIAKGAYVYVCGDAKRMAKDVEAALASILATHQNLTQDAAKARVAELKAQGRYQADVY